MNWKDSLRSLSARLGGQKATEAFANMNAYRCPNCGAPWAGEAQQCVRCGAWQPGAPRSDAAGLYSLVFINDDGLPWEYHIPTSGAMRIGRAEDNDIYLPHGLVSRRHALVWYNGSTYWLRDEGSLNGTLINGRPIAGTKAIQRGDTIEIGNTLFYLLAPSDPVPSAPDPDRLAWATGDDWISWSEGYHLGSYQLLRELGVGGMSTVWQARSPDYSGNVVVKIMNPDLLYDEEYAKRFWTEAEVGLHLRHPNIVKTFRFERSYNPPFIVMEYVDNVLPGLLERQAHRLTLDDTVPIVAQICDALSHAHDQGIVHRDVKPGNIFVEANGTAKLGDFGIAKVLTRSLTKAGTIWGTYKYMPPEQVQGEDIDHRADIYALGVVMYEFLTGQPPFLSEDPLMMAHMHIYNQASPPRQLNPSIPDYIDQAIMRALEKDRRRRFQSAQEMRSALGSVVQSRVSRRAEVDKATLVILSGENQGTPIPLNVAGLILRRQDLDPWDKGLSRKHARIFWKEGNYWVADLNSANGTFVNETKVVYPVALHNGDRIRLGRLELRFEG